MREVCGVGEAAEDVVEDGGGRGVVWVLSGGVEEGESGVGVFLGFEEG